MSAIVGQAGTSAPFRGVTSPLPHTRSVFYTPKTQQCAVRAQAQIRVAGRAWRRWEADSRGVEGLKRGQPVYIHTR